MREWRQIFWIDGSPPPGMALVLRPRGEEWLEKELTQLKDAGIDTLISMLEEDEASWLGLSDEESLADRAGLSFISFPIPDHHVPPDMTKFKAFVAGIADRLAAGEYVGVHCQGSIGRATVTAACALIHRGWKAQDALDAIELARGYEVPDTPEQRKWILRYQAGS